jgi:hypothetical protein
VTLQRILTRGLVSLLLVQALVPAARAGGQGAPVPAVAGAPQASASAPATTAPAVWLRGPFGRVPGGSLVDPATAPPGEQPLGTIVRGAPMVLEIDSGAAITALIVTALPFGAPGAAEPLSDGSLVFEGPDRVGSHLIVADVTTGQVTSEHAWLVDVPDRQAPVDGLYDIPAPEIVVGSSTASTAGRSGSGCYAYLCVDVGNPPPAETLPVLAAKVGELLTAQAADGSAIVAWEGRLTPLDEAAPDAVRGKAALTEPLAGVVSLTGLEPPMPGRWLLDLEVEFDRERGWMRTFYLLDIR